MPEVVVRFLVAKDMMASIPVLAMLIQTQSGIETTMHCSLSQTETSVAFTSRLNYVKNSVFL